MQQTNIYPRMAVMKVLPLITGILFLVTTFLQLATGNPVAFLMGIAALLFLVNGIWSVSTPYATVSNETISLKMGLLASLEVSFAEIERVEAESEKNVILHCRNGEKKTAKLHGMASDYREDFVKDITSRLA